MKYITSVALRRIKNNLVTNILIFIQMLIGIIMLTVFLNVNFFIRNEYKDYLAKNENNKFKLYANKINAEDQYSQPISYEQEELLKSKVGNKYSISVQYDIITFGGKSHIEANGESIVDRYVVEYSSETEDVLVESEFLETLKTINPENTVNYDDICFSYTDERILFESEKVNYKITDFNNAEYCHSIKIPIKYYYLYNKTNTFSECYIEVDLSGQSTDAINRMLYDIETQLYEYSNSYNYAVSNEFFDYLYKSSFDSNQAKLFSLISILLIVIVYIGMVSLFIMLIEKRKFEIAVCLALGAKIKQVFLELSIEFLLISITPSLIGLTVANILIERGFRFVNVYITQYSAIAEMLILLSIIILNFSCLSFVFYKIRKVKPQEILYKNR